MTTAAQLFSISSVPQGKEMGTHIACLSTPIRTDDLHVLTRALDAESLMSDSRALWLTYPGLRDAADKLIANISFGWPGQSSKYPAAVQAILEAIKKVQERLTHGEGTRELIVANYLSGLGTVAQDVAHTQAWGFRSNRVIEQWTSLDKNFVDWANEGGFDEVRFYPRTTVPANEMEGMRWKLLCAVASAKDIGVMSRYR